MHFVFLCGGFFPNYSATGNCVKEIALKMGENKNHKITIVCKNVGDKNIKEKWSGLSIFRVVNKRIKKDYQLSKKRRTLLVRMRVFLHKVYWAMYRLLSRAGLDYTLAKEYLLALDSINKEKEIHAVIPCCMPAETLYSSLLFSRKKQVMLFPLLYDLYSDNKDFFRFRFIHFLKRKKALKLEKDIFSISKNIFYTDNWGSYFGAHFYTNCLRVEHPLVVWHKTTNKHEPPFNSKFNAVYQGEINHQMRPPRAMVAFFEKLFSSSLDIKLHVFAYGNAVNEIVSFERENPDRVSFYGKVNKDVADSFFDSCNISLVLANKNADIVPSKIFECVASGKPIIYFFYSDKEKAYQLLERYPLVLFVNQNSLSYLDIEETNKWIEDSYNQRVPFNVVLDLYRDATPDFVVDTIFKKMNGIEL